MEKNSIVFYRSFYDACKKLSSSDFKEAMVGILAYAFDDEEIEFDSQMAQIIFTMAKPQIDANNARKVNGAKGGRPKTIGYEEENHRLSDEKPNVNVNVNDNANVNVNDNKKNNRVFRPPTLEEVQAYIDEKGYQVDAVRFVDFYTSKGWLVGKTKMKDWKASVRTWARQSDKTESVRQTAKSKVHDYRERSYDFDELMKGRV